ncbi:unnamed protein product [Discosporangium mesarthrocarpum]
MFAVLCSTSLPCIRGGIGGVRDFSSAVSGPSVLGSRLVGLIRDGGLVLMSSSQPEPSQPVSQQHPSTTNHHQRLSDRKIVFFGAPHSHGSHSSRAWLISRGWLGTPRINRPWGGWGCVCALATVPGR